MMARLLLSLLLVLLPALGAHARPVRQATPEELGQTAEVVVNGLVESVKLTDERGELRLGSNQPVPIRFAEATVKTLGATKGEITPVFTLRVSTYDPDHAVPIINGPMFASVQPGQRYRFYLKKNGAGYTGVLDGKFDDGAAIQPLAPGEAAASPPLLKDEAVALARDHFESLRPKISISTTIASFSSWNGARWAVQFYDGPPLEYPAFTSAAAIIVDGARAVAPGTWVGHEHPRKNQQLSNADIDRPMRLTVEGSFSKGVFRPGAGEITCLIGEITRIGKHEIRGNFSSPAFDQESGDRRLTIPREAIRSVQQLASGKNRD